MFVIFNMIKSSAIDILKTFSDEELSLFEEFIGTPFHNKNVKVVHFFALLKKYHPEYSGEGLTKENLFLQLNGNVKYKDTYIRNLFSDLSSLAEKFLQLELVSKDKTYERLLIEEIKNRDLFELAGKKIKTMLNSYTLFLNTKVKRIFH